MGAGPTSWALGSSLHLARSIGLVGGKPAMEGASGGNGGGGKASIVYTTRHKDSFKNKCRECTMMKQKYCKLVP